MDVGAPSGGYIATAIALKWGGLSDCLRYGLGSSRYSHNGRCSREFCKGDHESANFHDGRPVRVPGRWVLTGAFSQDILSTRPIGLVDIRDLTKEK